MIPATLITNNFVIDVVLFKKEVTHTTDFSFFFPSEIGLVKIGTRISKATSKCGCTAIPQIKSWCSASSENLLSWRHPDWANFWDHGLTSSDNNFKLWFMCDNTVNSYLVCLPCSMLHILKAKKLLNFSIKNENLLFLAKGSFFTFF